MKDVKEFWNSLYIWGLLNSRIDAPRLLERLIITTKYNIMTAKLQDTFYMLSSQSITLPQIHLCWPSWWYIDVTLDTMLFFSTWAILVPEFFFIMFLFYFLNGLIFSSAVTVQVVYIIMFRMYYNITKSAQYRFIVLFLCNYYRSN